MTFGLAAVTAWGSARFDVLAPQSEWPFQLGSETLAEFEARLDRYGAALVDAGTTLFNEFFLIAAGLSLLALLPAAVMAWRRR